MAALPSRATLLVVDDDPRLLKLVSTFLSVSGYEVKQAASCAAARRIIESESLDLVVTDSRLPDGSGIELLELVVRQSPELPVILVTAYGTVEEAVKAMGRGAFHFMVKPFLMDQLKALVDRGVEVRRLRSQNVSLLTRVGDGANLGLVGESAAVGEVRRMIESAAPTPATVLITGESGTGKEIVARLVHEKSLRRDKPFVRLNCAALPHDLLEAELFGHRKGAFTGAATDRTGRFRAAHGGTLFLDEIASLDYDVQAKLLRVLQGGELSPLGSDEVIKTNVRIVAATNQDLREMVTQKQFREDLFYRLNVFPIDVPPLRDRMEDLPHLARHFVREISGRMNRPQPALPEEQLQVLERYAWPGNVRELENFIERSIILCAADSLRFEGMLPSDQVPFTPPLGKMGLGEALDVMERRMVRGALRRASGVKKQAAALLGVSQRAFSYYLKKHGIRG